MRILIGGDLVVTGGNSAFNIDSSIVDLFKNSDLNILNLEAPITDSTKKYFKTGPHLKSDMHATLKVLNTLDVNLCTLANNHILDYGEQGVFDTLNFCKNHNIQTVGSGKNKEEAARIFYLTTNEYKIAIINIAENEWASATDETAGANGMDLISNVESIQEAKNENTFVIVIVHGGHEYYNLPSPRMQKQYRFYIDNGADLVVGHHTHCLSGMEKYKNKSIYYSLGNFIFTNHSNYEDWYIGVVLDIQLSGQNVVCIPRFIKQDKGTFQIAFFEDEEVRLIEERFTNYSKIISNKDELMTRWKRFVLEKSDQYDNYLSPLSFVKNKYLVYVLSRIGFNGSNKKGRALLLNLLRCEAHSDLSKEILNGKFIK